MLYKLTPARIVRTGALYGAYASLAYVVYFLLMRLIGMATVVELRFLNYVFLCIAGFYAARKAESIKQWRLKYLQAFIIIYVTGAFSYIYFTIFMLFYSFVDPIIINTFTAMFSGSAVFGRYSAPFLIASEGLSFSAIISLGMGFFVLEYSGHLRKPSGEVIGMDQKA